ncbi:uncharacterized protein LOC108625505 [Ceratina calcarata]|uniref:Uncharacterized protein LOC108625505 n=1 Tax=Ceratina calcarata TaxID=156304 RepID=A0AAJ7J0G9_9HYME|nr:uncharacterized protein LOC108625505 [Ceratina calcarata]
MVTYARKNSKGTKPGGRKSKSSEETDGRPPIPLKLLRIKKKLESNDDDSDSQESKQTSDRKKKISRSHNSNEKDKSDELRIRKSNSDESSREENSRENKNRGRKNRDKNDSSQSNLTEDSSDVSSADKSRNSHSNKHNSRNKLWKRESKESDSDSNDDTDSDEEEFKKYLQNALKKKHNRQIQEMLRNGDIDGRNNSSRKEIYYNKLYKWNRDSYLEWKKKIDLKAQILSAKHNLNREKLMSICNIPGVSEDDEQEDQIRKCVKSHVATNDKFNITTDLSVIHSPLSGGKNVSKWVENGNDSKIFKIRIDKPQPNGNVQRINILKEVPTGVGQSSNKSVHKTINKVNSSVGIPVSDNLVPAINKASSSTPEQVDNSKGSESTVDKGTSDNKDNDSTDVQITEKGNNPSSNKEKSSDDGKKQIESNLEVEVEGQQKSIIPVEQDVNTEITNQEGNKQSTSESQSGILPTENGITSSKLPTGNSETNVSNNTGISNGVNSVLDIEQTDSNKTFTSSVNSTNEVSNTVQEQKDTKPEVIVVPETPEVILEADQATEASISKTGTIDDNVNVNGINISANTSNVLKENESNVQQNSSVIDTTSRNQAASSSKIEGSNVTKVEETEKIPAATRVDDNKPNTTVEINNTESDSKKSNGNVNEQTSISASTTLSSATSVPETRDSSTIKTDQIETTSSRSESTFDVSIPSSDNGEITNDVLGAVVNEKSTTNTLNVQPDSSTIKASTLKSKEATPLSENGSSIIVEESKGLETILANNSSNASNNLTIVVESNNILNNNESTNIINDETSLNDSRDSQTTLFSTQPDITVTPDRQIIDASSSQNSTLVNNNVDASNNSSLLIKLNNSLDSISNIQVDTGVGVSTTLESNDKTSVHETASHVIEEDQVFESSSLQPEVILSDDANLLNNHAIKTELNNTSDNDNVSIVTGKDDNESTTSGNVEPSTSQTESSILTEIIEPDLQLEIIQADSTNVSNNAVIKIESNDTSDIHQLNNNSSEADMGVSKSTSLRETLATSPNDDSTLTTTIVIVDKDMNVSDNQSVLANNTIDDTDRLSRNVSEPSDVNANQSTVLNSVQSEKFTTVVISIANSAAGTVDSQTSDSELNTPSVTVNLLTVNEDDLIYNTVVSETVSSVSPTENPSSESPVLN